MKKLIACLSLILMSGLADAKPKIQNEDIRALTDITAAVLTTTGSIANGSACITSVGSTTGLAIGLFIYDTTTPANIASGVTIAGLPGTCSSGQIQMSANSTQTASSQTITFGGQKSQLVNDSKMYVTGASLNDQLSTLLTNNSILNTSSTTQATIPAALTLSGGVGIPSNVAIGSINPFGDTALYVNAPSTQLSTTSQWSIVGNAHCSAAATTKCTAGSFVVQTAAGSSVGTGYGLFLDSVLLGSGATMGHYAGLTLAGDTPAGASQSYAIYTSGAAQSQLGGNLTVVGARTLLNNTASNTGLTGAFEATNPGGGYSGFITDTGGRGFRVVTPDFNNSTTGSALSVSLGTGSGNTYSVLQGIVSGSTATGILALNASGGNVGIGLINPTSPLQVVGNIASSGTLIGTGANGAMPIQGTNTNDNASAGKVGEEISSNRLRTSATALTNGTDVNVLATPLTLTTGDWELTGFMGYTGSSTVITQVIAAASKTSGVSSGSNAPTNSVGALDTRDGCYASLAASSGGLNVNNGDITITLSPLRVTLGTGQTIYLVANAAFGSGTVSVYGRLTARRIR